MGWARTARASRSRTGSNPPSSPSTRPPTWGSDQFITEYRGSAKAVGMTVAVRSKRRRPRACTARRGRAYVAF